MTLKLQLRLLTLLCGLFTTTLYAQIVVDVEIRGIDKAMEENVRLFLSIEQQKNHELISEGRLRRLHSKSNLEIKNALQPFGYYHPEIEARLTKLSANNWQVTYDINPGPPLVIETFNLILSDELNQDAEFQLLTQNLTLKTGDVFNHVDYEGIKVGLIKLASERGYIDARFIEHRVAINLDLNTARIHLNYDGGARYHFGTVTLHQNILDEKLIRRYIPFESGSAYSLNKLIDFQQALIDSDYFHSVEITPGQAETGTQLIPVDVTLSPRKPNRYSLGLGYGTDTGARMKLGWEKPRLNQKGHRLKTEARLSEIGYSLSADYFVPIRNPRTDQLVYSAAVVNETTDSSESTLRTIGASINRSRGAWRESISLNYQQEDFIIANVRGDSTLLLPGINWSRIWGDDFINTFDGLRFDINFRGANKALISDSDFFQLQSGIKAINSLNKSNRIITRGRLGSTWTDEFDQLPSSVRFFAGGAQSVRGYSYQSLGPVNSSGLVIGGKHLVVGSIEYEYSFREKWSVALFYDAGNAIDDINDDLEHGAGFGFRWKSPIGPIRFDLASALSKQGDPWRLHITIGPDL